MGEVHIPRNFSISAAIQFKNPGAMWPGAVATKWGSVKWQYLSDGTGQGGGGHGNKIAIFDNWVDGISAQLDLWRTSANYRNKTFLAAISTWSGHNHVQSYVDYLKSRVPGLSEGTVMNDTFWRGPMAIPFLRAQATHEAGKPIPATQADYDAAQKRVMSGLPTPKTTQTVAKVAVVAVTPILAAHAAGHSLALPALLVGIAVAIVAGVVIYVKRKAQYEQVQERVGSPPDPQPVLGDVAGQVPSPVHTEGT